MKFVQLARERAFLEFFIGKFLLIISDFIKNTFVQNMYFVDQNMYFIVQNIVKAPNTIPFHF